MAGNRGFAHAPLRFADRPQLGPGTAVGEDGGGQRLALASFRRAAQFDQRRGKAQGVLAQIGGRVRLVLQNRQHVARLQRRADAAAHRLAPVALDDDGLQPEGMGDIGERPAEGDGGAPQSAPWPSVRPARR